MFSMLYFWNSTSRLRSRVKHLFKMSLENSFIQIKLKCLRKSISYMIECPEIHQNIHFKINSKSFR